VPLDATWLQVLAPPPPLFDVVPPPAGIGARLLAAASGLRTGRATLEANGERGIAALNNAAGVLRVLRVGAPSELVKRCLGGDGLGVVDW